MMLYQPADIWEHYRNQLEWARMNRIYAELAERWLREDQMITEIVEQIKRRPYGKC